ncbi:hypothetical protein [Salinirubrum litoreum]|uniref:Uncharacterized protein n=1 Tax=Salinirubrum litoreum TaxID=1126234 RepID=A0ABD5R957_9EURY|nr:hypothetical protein [Salinirubrum litoreum]
MSLAPVPPTDAVVADLANRGYRLDHPEGWNTPAAVATPEGETTPVTTAPGETTEAPLAVEPLASADPLTLVARLADAADAGRRVLFVADPETASEVVETLGDPFLLRADTDAGRQFYTIPDRILLTDDSYACVRTDADLAWREERSDEAAGPEATARLVLDAGEETVAVLDSVDGLTCPGPTPETFRHRYRRGDDKRIHVFDRDGPVGRYAGISAMKANAYRPVPLPLVPEHHLRENPRLARAWSLAVVDPDGEFLERGESEAGGRYLDADTTEVATTDESDDTSNRPA